MSGNTMRPAPWRVITAFAKQDVPENVAVPDTPKYPPALGASAINMSSRAGIEPIIPLQTPVRLTCRPSIVPLEPAPQPPVMVYVPCAASPLADSVTSILTT